MNEKLDNYETALLTELRTYVAERQVTATRPRRTLRRLAFVGVAAAAAAGIAVVSLPGGGTPAASAYSTVSVAPNGGVQISVSLRDDADTVERVLADHGVNADVTFLQSNGTIGDSFRMIKGHGGPTNPCGVLPATGCSPSAKGSLGLRKNVADNSRDAVSWRWKLGTIPVADIGSPSTQDYAFCVYDAVGKKAGGKLLPGAGWTPHGADFTYSDKKGLNGPIRRARLVVGNPPRAQLSVQGRGTGLGLIGTLSTAPMKAQLVNLDTGKCWETNFPTIVRQDASKLSARLP